MPASSDRDPPPYNQATMSLKRKIKKKSKKVEVQKAQRPLKSHFRGGKRLYATYKGKDYRAWLFGSGTVEYNGKPYNSPTAAAKIFSHVVWRDEDVISNIIFRFYH
jgi:hypothetical protein